MVVSAGTAIAEFLAEFLELLAEFAEQTKGMVFSVSTGVLAKLAEDRLRSFVMKEPMHVQ